MTIGKRIKKLRTDINMSQVDFAELIGVSKQTLYKYENDIITNIPSDKIELIAEKTKATPGFIMGWEPMSDNEIADVIHENMQTNISIEPEFPLNIRSAARDMMELSEADQELAINMIRSLARKGRKGE